MKEIPEIPKDNYLDLMGGDFDFQKHRERLRGIRAPILGEAIRAFIFNLQNVDSLLLSPFVIAADGVEMFYWTLKYVKATNSHILSAIRGRDPDKGLLGDRESRISEANSIMKEFLGTPGATEELANQIDSRLRQLLQRPDFVSAMRVQLLSSVVLLWTAYETLRNGLKPIADKYDYSPQNLRPSKSEAGRFTSLKEYRNVIVHKAGVVDERFVRRVGLQQVGEQLKIDATIASQFFESVCHVGTVMLRAFDRHIQRKPARPVT